MFEPCIVDFSLVQLVLAWWLVLVDHVEPGPATLVRSLPGPNSGHLFPQLNSDLMQIEGSQRGWFYTSRAPTPKHLDQGM